MREAQGGLPCRVDPWPRTQRALLHVQGSGFKLSFGTVGFGGEVGWGRRLG